MICPTLLIPICGRFACPISTTRQRRPSDTPTQRRLPPKMERRKLAPPGHLSDWRQSMGGGSDGIASEEPRGTVSESV